MGRLREGGGGGLGVARASGTRPPNILRSSSRILKAEERLLVVYQAS